MNSKKILDIQIHQFSDAWRATETEEDKLREDFNIARNCAASEWSSTLTPTNWGGTHVLQPVRLIPELLDQLHKNQDLLLEELSLRRYVLLLTYMDVIKKSGREMDGRMKTCFEYWHNKFNSKEANQ